MIVVTCCFAFIAVFCNQTCPSVKHLQDISVKVITVIKLRPSKGERTENTNRYNSSKGG